MSKQEIRNLEFSREIFWKDRVILINVLLLFVLMVVGWVLWVVLYRNTEIIIGMPQYFNFLQFNQNLMRYALPIFGSAAAFFHLLIAFFTYNRERLISYFLVGGVNFLQLLILITVIYYMSNF